MKFSETARMCVSLSDKYFRLKMCCFILEEFNVNIRLSSVDLLYPDPERSFTLYLTKRPCLCFVRPVLFSSYKGAGASLRF